MTYQDLIAAYNYPTTVRLQQNTLIAELRRVRNGEDYAATARCSNCDMIVYGNNRIHSLEGISFDRILHPLNSQLPPIHDSDSIRCPFCNQYLYYNPEHIFSTIFTQFNNLSGQHIEREDNGFDDFASTSSSESPSMSSEDEVQWEYDEEYEPDDEEEDAT